MANTIKGNRKGTAAAPKTIQGVLVAQRFEAGGKIVKCSHCGNDGFASIGTGGISYAGFGLTCSRCTKIEYFRRMPTEAR